MPAFFYVVTWLWGYLITFQTQIHLQPMKAWNGSLLTSKDWLGIRAPLPFQVTIARFWRNHWFFAPAIWYGWWPDLWLGIQTNDAAFWSSCCILGDSSHVSLCKMLQFATQSCMADPFGMRYQWWYYKTSSRSWHLWMNTYAVARHKHLWTNADLKRCECKKNLGTLSVSSASGLCYGWICVAGAALGHPVCCLCHRRPFLLRLDLRGRRST